MKKNSIIIATLAILTALYLWYFSDKNVVLRKSEKLIECFDKETGARGLGSSNFSDLLYEKVAISLPEDEDDIASGLPRDRASLTAIFTGVMRGADELTIERKSITLDSIDSKQAIVSLYFHAKVSFPRYNKNDDLMAKVTFIRSEESGNKGWRIKKITIHEQ